MAVRPKGKGRMPVNFIYRKCAVKMWKQIAAARGLPLQGLAQRFCCESRQNQPIGTGKMFGGGLMGLCGGGKMDEPISKVNRGTVGVARGLKTGPFLGPKDFVNQHVPHMPSDSARVKLGEAFIGGFALAAGKILLTMVPITPVRKGSST